MHKLCRLKGDEIKALVPVVQSQEYAEYAKSHSQEEVGLVFVHVLEEAGVYKCTPKGREDFMRFVDSL